jgi:hypothetical protein
VTTAAKIAAAPAAAHACPATASASTAARSTRQRFHGQCQGGEECQKDKKAFHKRNP